MIGRTNRFHGRAVLQRHYDRSKSVRSGVLALRYAPNERRKTYRLAVVVSRKVSKSAVVRNRIRRRLYENVRILSNQFTAPYDLVLLVYDEKVAAQPPADLSRDIAALCRKASLTTATKTPGRAIVEPKE
jgi:ribonuclease P protein component